MAVPKRKQTPSRTGMRRAQTMKYSTKNIEYLLDYFDKFNINLSKKTLNSFIKSVNNP